MGTSVRTATSTRLRPFSSAIANLGLLLLCWLQVLINEFKDDFEGRFGFLFQRLNLPGQFLMCCEDRTEPNEGTHDGYVDLNGPSAAQHAGEHSHTMFREYIGQIP